MAKIWERHFFWEISKVFLLFITCFYGLYILIDYSSRSSAYQTVPLNSIEIFYYYRDIILERLEIVLPFALLIATIRTLCQLNVRNELIALLSSGIRLHILLRPFLLFSLLCTFILYANSEFLLPGVYKNKRLLEDAHFKEKYKKEKNRDIHHILLEDGSVIIYNNYVESERAFHDLYWIYSFDKVLRMKKFFPFEKVPYGQFIDEFQRRENGELDHVQSWERKKFQDKYFDRKTIKESTIRPSEISFSQLFKKYFKRTSNQKKQALIDTSFYYRLFMPWLCLLVFIGPAPYCLQFTRSLPTFSIYVCGMLVTVSFYLIIHAALILSEHEVIAPFLAIGLPFAGLLTYFGWRYVKAIQ